MIGAVRCSDNAPRGNRMTHGSHREMQSILPAGLADAAQNCPVEKAVNTIGGRWKTGGEIREARAHDDPLAACPHSRERKDDVVKTRTRAPELVLQVTNNRSLAAEVCFPDDRTVACGLIELHRRRCRRPARHGAC